jgi:hypothetical protein
MVSNLQKVTSNQMRTYELALAGQKGLLMENWKWSMIRSDFALYKGRNCEVVCRDGRVRALMYEDGERLMGMISIRSCSSGCYAISRRGHSQKSSLFDFHAYQTFLFMYDPDSFYVKGAPAR